MAETALLLGVSHSKSTYPTPLVPRLDMFTAMGDGVSPAAR